MDSIVILGVAAALASVMAGLGVAAVMGRRLRREIAERERTATNDAGLAEAMARLVEDLTAEVAAEVAAGVSAERDHTVHLVAQQLSAEAAAREQSLQVTVDTVLSLAGDKLGAHTSLASQELDLRSQAFDEKVAGMHAELHRVSQLVTDLQRDKAQQHGEIVHGIGEAIRASTALSDTTQSLREALSNSRARGQWGERMADDVLRSAGFVEGVSYTKQATLPGGGRPDFTFLLPRDRCLHMDVKFPVDNYLRWLDADRDDDRAVAAKAFVRDVRARVKELSVRDYTDPDATVGYVLLFIPNESVYGFIHEHDPLILDDALGQQVVLCSPCTLFAVLGVVRQAVDTFLLSRTSDEILECLNGFTKQWTAFSDKLDKLGNQFATAQRSFEELSGTRRTQLQKQLDRVDRLRSSRGLDGVDAASAGLPALVAPGSAELGTDQLGARPGGVGVRHLDDVRENRLDVDLGELVAETDELPLAAAGAALVAHPTSARRVPRLRPLR